MAEFSSRRSKQLRRSSSGGVQGGCGDGYCGVLRRGAMVGGVVTTGCGGRVRQFGRWCYSVVFVVQIMGLVPHFVIMNITGFSGNNADDCPNVVQGGKVVPYDEDSCDPKAFSGVDEAL
nr:hypothetical protein Iba_chr08fCG2430 [Ipomoea batatas]